ncbi:hypothetical protein RV02_GL001971 [Enterococcus gilvus]|nr:hypothetical protein RV02_GL001971 [Enterococcus gilvus]
MDEFKSMKSISGAMSFICVDGTPIACSPFIVFPNAEIVTDRFHIVQHIAYILFRLVSTNTT